MTATRRGLTVLAAVAVALTLPALRVQPESPPTTVTTVSAEASAEPGVDARPGVDPRPPAPSRFSIAGPAAAPLSLEEPARAEADLSAALVKEAAFDSGIDDGWAAVERYRATNPGFQPEVYPADGRGDQVGQTSVFFANARPHSSLFLLHAGPPPTAPAKSPVLLVHGANQTASQAWANPNAGGNFGCGQVTCPTEGMMQRLTAEGHQVYAIGFPHRNGDGYYWAEQIGLALDVIRQKESVEKVDVVGWSKGAFNARMYASSVRQSWGSDYAGTIDRLVLLGNPNLGFDWGFRHGWSHTAAIFPECGGSLNAPGPHTSMICFFVRHTHPELSYSSDAFPGSAQMLARWDQVHALPAYEQDWYTTYYGGRGFYTSGPGIQQAIDRSSLVQTIVQAGTPNDLPVYLLCGTAPTMAGLHNEHTGPSDGAVFVLSCASEQGIGNHADTARPFLNHLELGWSRTSADQVVEWLS